MTKQLMNKRIEKLEKIISVLLATSRKSIIDGFCNQPQEIIQAVGGFNRSLEIYDKELEKIDKALIGESQKIFEPAEFLRILK